VTSPGDDFTVGRHAILDSVASFLNYGFRLYFSSFQNNYEILMTLLKNIRDYDPNVQVKIDFNAIKIKLIDYYPQGFAFRAIHNIEKVGRRN